jgi:hypothetical protein
MVQAALYMWVCCHWQSYACAMPLHAQVCEVLELVLLLFLTQRLMAVWFCCHSHAA